MNSTDDLIADAGSGPAAAVAAGFHALWAWSGLWILAGMVFAPGWGKAAEPTASPASVAAASASSARPDTLAQPPELAALNDQFLKLQAERVSGPLAAGMGKLKASYLSGLERELAKETAAGELERVLAIKQEAQRFATEGTVPDTDADNLAASVKQLRGIFRDAQLKLEQQRVANLKMLAEPLGVRLKQLEVDMTKASRIADALAVRNYRVNLGANVDDAVAVAAKASVANAVQASPPAAPPTALSSAPKEGIINSLGMTFVPVPGTRILMCIHETRKRDYAAFAAENPSVEKHWIDVKDAGIAVSETDDHPVVMVNWQHASEFCAWLSKKEGRTYRLPTDREWSFAIGIGKHEPEGLTLEELSRRTEDREFPWGEKGSIPDKAGNLGDQSFRERFPEERFLPKFRDGYVTTAPVMSFKRSRLGIYDLEGNVTEWCQEWYDADKTQRVQRGGSWKSGAVGTLFSSFRNHKPAWGRHSDVGFRCVLERP